jgi:hypothetical protein
MGSAEAHIKGSDDDIVVAKPLLKIVGDWRKFLAEGISDKEYKFLRRHERPGDHWVIKNLFRDWKKSWAKY